MLEPSNIRISAARTIANCILVPRTIVSATVQGLRQRSDGWRESACVWIGDYDGRVRHTVFHHEVADDKANALSLELPEKAKFSLYQQLARDKQRVLALLHTHPDRWVGLSWIDQQNQISSRIGFLSIVLPDYGSVNWDVDAIGFHVKCERGWSRLTTSEVHATLKIDECC
jgi:hypothetical protein